MNHIKLRPLGFAACIAMCFIGASLFADSEHNSVARFAHIDLTNDAFVDNVIKAIDDLRSEDVWQMGGESPRSIWTFDYAPESPEVGDMKASISYGINCFASKEEKNGRCGTIVYYTVWTLDNAQSWSKFHEYQFEGEVRGYKDSKSIIDSLQWTKSEEQNQDGETVERYALTADVPLPVLLFCERNKASGYRSCFFRAPGS